MSKMILLNTVRVQDSMVMYALSGGTLTVMLQYLNGFAANNVLLTVVGKTYAELLAETGFIEVATVSAGSCQIVISNVGSVASEAPIITFVIIKAVNN